MPCAIGGAVSPPSAMSIEDLSHPDEGALLLDEFKSTEEGCIEGEILAPIPMAEVSPADNFKDEASQTQAPSYLPATSRVHLTAFFGDRCRTINVLQNAWHALRPEWTAPRQERKLHPTSWLDGLRGLAALFVVLHHCSRYITDLRGRLVLDFAHLLEFPIISVVVSGTSMVDVFFVVSGYCLSYKALQSARAGQHAQLFNGLSSSTFRRSLRLFLPCLVSSFITAILAYAGYPVRAPREASLLRQLYSWAYEFVQSVSPYRVVTNTGAFAFGDVLWTIPVEFRGSLHVFLCLLALGRAKNSMRLMMLVLIQMYLSLTGRWDVLLFNSGMLCSEIHVRYQEQAIEPQRTLTADCSFFDSPSIGTSRRFFGIALRKALRTSRACWMNVISFLFLLFLLGRQHQPHNYGPFKNIYSTFRFESPDSWKHAEPGEQQVGAGRPIIVLASSLLVLQIGFFPQVRTLIFETRFVQYLGDISYSLYLTHSSLLDTVGDTCFASTWSAFDHAFLRGNGDSFIDVHSLRLLVWMTCMVLLFGPLMFWVSDIFARQIDRRSIKFAKWLERRCFRTTSQSE